MFRGVTLLVFLLAVHIPILRLGRGVEENFRSAKEALVYSLLADLLDQGSVGRQELVTEMAANHVRHDSLDLIDRYRGWIGIAAIIASGIAATVIRMRAAPAAPGEEH